MRCEERDKETHRQRAKETVRERHTQRVKERQTARRNRRCAAPWSSCEYASSLASDARFHACVGRARKTEKSRALKGGRGWTRDRERDRERERAIERERDRQQERAKRKEQERDRATKQKVGGAVVIVRVGQQSCERRQIPRVGGIHLHGFSIIYLPGHVSVQIGTRAEESNARFHACDRSICTALR